MKTVERVLRFRTVCCTELFPTILLFVCLLVCLSVCVFFFTRETSLVGIYGNMLVARRPRQ